jgi:ketosteroid isomerase-like protein
VRHASRKWILSILIALAACLAACEQPQPQAPPETRATDEASLRNVDLQWSKAADAKTSDQFVAFFADGAIFLPPNLPAMTSKEAIQRWMAGLMSNPGFALSWQPTKVGVSAGGDMGYTAGLYQLKLAGPKGKPVSDQGKYLTVWKKQADGSWRVVADTFNSDLPPEGPASH